jgi:hypothetical protein
MSILDKFEQRIGNTVNAVFSKIGANELQPVDLMSLLKNNVDSKAETLADGRVVIPNDFEIQVSTDSYDKVESWGAETFADELKDSLASYATQQGFTFLAPINIRIQEDLAMEKGKFGVSSQNTGELPKDPIPPVAVPEPVEPELAETVISQTSDDKTRGPQSGRPVLIIDERVIELTKAVTVLGRDENADISVNDKGVSRSHLEFKVQKDGHVVVTDMGSTNGLFVEGHHTPDALLQDGNVLTVGRTNIQFRRL